MPARPATTDDLAHLEDRLVRSRKEDLAHLEDRLTRSWKADLERFATKDDLEGMKIELRGEMRDIKAELRGEMKDIKAELIQHIADASVHTAAVVVDQMCEELARHTAASAEETRMLVRAFDDRYRDLPEQVAALRRDVDELRGGGE